MGKSRENAAACRKKNRGKPRKYGPGKAELCRHVGISMPRELADRLAVAAKQISVSRSAVVVAAVRAALAQSPDRLAAEVASSGRAADADALTTHTAAILPLPSCGWESAIAGLGLASQTREPHR